MEDLGLLIIVMGFVFTIFAIFGLERRLIAALLSVIIWFPVSAMVAAETTAVKGFWFFFFGLGMLMFVWSAILIMETITGKLLVSKERAEE